MSYVDGFLLAVPKKNLRAYASMSRKTGTIWRDHGALDYRECVADDLATKLGTPFSRILKLKRAERPSSPTSCTARGLTGTA